MRRRRRGAAQYQHRTRRRRRRRDGVAAVGTLTNTRDDLLPRAREPSGTPLRRGPHVPNPRPPYAYRAAPSRSTLVLRALLAPSAAPLRLPGAMLSAFFSLRRARPRRARGTDDDVKRLVRPERDGRHRDDTNRRRDDTPKQRAPSVPRDDVPEHEQRSARRAMATSASFTRDDDLRRKRRRLSHGGSRPSRIPREAPTPASRILRWSARARADESLVRVLEEVVTYRAKRRLGGDTRERRFESAVQRHVRPRLETPRDARRRRLGFLRGRRRRRRWRPAATPVASRVVMLSRGKRRAVPGVPAAPANA